MSGYASVILRPGGVIYHTAWADSHESIIRALGLGDIVVGAEYHYLRASAPDGDMAYYYIDDEDPNHLPAWYTEHEAEYCEKLAELLGRISALREKLIALHIDFKIKYDALYADFTAKRDALEAEYMSLPGAVRPRGWKEEL